MDAAVGDQGLDGEAGDLAADAVEGRQHDRLGRVVDDDVDARQVLEGADVSALAADDPALEVVGGELDDRDRCLGGVPGGGALDRDRQDVPGPLVGLEAGLLLDAPNELCHIAAALLLDLRHEHVAALGGGQPGDLLELGDLGVAGGLELLLELLGVGLAVGDRLIAARELLDRRLELALARRQALLDLDDLGPALGQVTLLLGALSQELLARRDARFLHLGVRLAAGVLQDPLCLPLGVADPAAPATVLDQDAGARSPCEGERDQQRLHRVSLCTCRRSAAGIRSVCRPGRRRPPGRAEARAASACGEG